MTPGTYLLLAFLISGVSLAIVALAAMLYHDRTHRRDRES